MTIIWDYDRLICEARAIESTVANLTLAAELQAAYKTGTQGADLHTRRAWAECGPEAARRTFGDCQAVNDLAAVAVRDLENIEERN